MYRPDPQARRARHNHNSPAARTHFALGGAMPSLIRAIALFAALVVAALPAFAANYPDPKEGSWVARDFKFHTGEVMPEVTLHYRTIGSPSNEAVLVLHGTAGSGARMLTKNFAGELFGPGQPLDASKYFLILPDALGTGKSTRPSSSGLRMKFPRYNYDDMVQAHYRLVTEGLGVKHLRLIIGNSMGGMQAWVWATKYPDMMDAAVPMACQPGAMSGRNWMMRRLLADSIRNDPEWNNGNYTEQPRSMSRLLTYFSIATSNGNIALYNSAPTSAQGDALLAKRIAAPFRGDANDVLYQWESSADYDPSPGLERIQAMVLAINAQDDERNPPELGMMERAMARISNGRYLEIPQSADTRGHGTTGMAKFYKKELEELLKRAPRRNPG
jgi:homoserine O-acetyltransferase/O-succinyltransferase